MQSAKDLYQFAQDNLQTTQSTHTRRRVFRYLDEVNRSESDPSIVKPVPQIRSIHQVRNSTTGLLTARSLSCYTCDNCLDSGLNDTFKQISQTGSFRLVKIGCDNESEENKDSDVDMHVDTDDDELISTGMVIAVVADDPDSEYFLLKVTKPAYTLRKASNDSWGASYSKGASVIGGLYYGRDSGSRLSYSLIKRKPAAVPSNPYCDLFAAFRR